MSVPSDDGLAPQPTPDPLTQRLVQLTAERARLEEAAAGLEKARAWKSKAAGEAEASADDLRQKAEAQRRLRDRYAGERADELLREAQAAEVKAARLSASARQYESALEQVRRTQQRYLEVVSGTRAGDPNTAPSLLPAVENEVGAINAALDSSIAATVPPRDVLPNGVPTGRLPHITELTDRLNAAVGSPAVSGRPADPAFTPELLGRTLRAEFRRVVSDDGLILPVGDPAGDVEATKLAQVWIRLEPGRLSEVVDPQVSPSEMIQGGFPQGGRTINGTLTRSRAEKFGAGLGSLTAALPDHNPLHAVNRVVAPGAEVSRTKSRALTTTSTSAALDGGVEDNRGDAVLCQAPARYQIAVRSGALQPWTMLPPVEQGRSTDADELRIWISAAYSVPPAEKIAQLPEARAKRHAELPEHAVSSMNGLNELGDRVAGGAAQALGGLDRVGYDQIRSLITEDLPGRLRESTAPTGLSRLIHANGAPVAFVNVHSTVDRSQVAMLGEASTEHWQERLRIDFSGAGGAEAFDRAGGTTVHVGPGSKYAGWPEGISLGPAVNAGRGTGRGDSLSAGRTAIHPSVQRYVGPTQGYRLRMNHDVTIHPIGNPTPTVVSGSTQGVFRFPENDAFRYGLPVDARALLSEPGPGGPDQHAALRGDPRPPKEPLGLPEYVGDGAGRLRGVGPGMVRDLEGADEARSQFLSAIAGTGLLPALDDDGNPKPGELSSNPQTYASQLQNLERVLSTVSRTRLETSFDEACQGGLLFDLQRHRPGLPPERRTFRVSLLQDFAGTRCIGETDHEPPVNLEIGSEATSRTISRERSFPFGGRVSVRGADPAPGTAPWEAGGGHSRTLANRSHDVVAGRLDNGVTIAEGKHTTAQFDQPVAILVTEETARGESGPLAHSQGRARLLIAKNLCSRPDRGTSGASNDPGLVRPQPTVDPEVLGKAQLLHVDAREPLTRLQQQLPAATRSDSVSVHHLAAFLGPRNLVAHPEWMTSRYQTRFALSRAAESAHDLRNGGLMPTQSSVALRGQVSDVRFAGAAEMVTGDINLTLRNFGVTSRVTRPRTSDGALDAGQAGGGGGRATTRSESTTATETHGWERLVIRLGQHYQFVADCGFQATVRSDDNSAGSQGAEQRIDLPGGRVLFTLPERDALQHYGRGQLELPLEQVADATERMINGELELDRRTSTAMIARYHQHRAAQLHATGNLTGLAAEHDDRTLQTLLRKSVGLPEPAAQQAAQQAARLPEPQQTAPAQASEQSVGPTQPTFQQTLIEAAQLSTLRRDAQLPEHYRDTMAGSMISSAVFAEPPGYRPERPGERPGPYAAARLAIAQVAPELLQNDPVLAESLSGDLDDKRWRGQMDDMLDPNGFLATYPLRAETGRNASAQELRLRIRAVFDGPPMIDGKPDGTPATAPTDALSLLQGYDYRERSRTSSRSVRVEGKGNGQLETGGLDGAVAETTAEYATELNRTTSATSLEQETRLQRLAHHTTAHVERGIRMLVEAELLPGDGAATVGARREARAVDRLPAKNVGRVELSGRIEQQVPKGLIDVGVAPRDGFDHRPVELPAVTVEGSRPYLPGEPVHNSLYTAITERLGRSKLLTGAGVERYRNELAMMVSASARNAAFQRLTGPEGHDIVPGLPVPGHSDRKVYVRARASVSDLALVSPPTYAEKGEVDRSMHAVKTSTSEARLLPGAVTVKHEAGAGVSGSVTYADRVSETITDTSGKRNETTMFEAGDVVTARVRLDYRFDYERRKINSDLTEKVEHRESQPNAARSEAYVTMFVSEYEEMQRKMESGRSSEPAWNPALQPAAAEKPLTVRADEFTAGPDGQPQYRPYQPLLGALARARSEGRVVDLRVTERAADGTVVGERPYLAHPNGTLRGHQDAGFAAAFATVNPRLVTLAEGRVDLRALHVQQVQQQQVQQQQVQHRQPQRSDPRPDLTASLCSALQGLGYPPEALIQARQAVPRRAVGEAAADRRASAEQATRGISNHNRGGADGVSF